MDLKEVREPGLRMSKVRAFCAEGIESAKALGWEWLHRCEEWRGQRGVQVVGEWWEIRSGVIRPRLCGACCGLDPSQSTPIF